MKICPKCKSNMMSDSCTCGFIFNKRANVLCSYRNKSGYDCLMPGMVSNHIPTAGGDYPPFYCSFHFSLSKGEEPTKEKLLEHLLKFSPKIADSSFDWVNYLWKKSCGFDQEPPPAYAFDYLKIEPMKKCIDKII